MTVVYVILAFSAGVFITQAAFLRQLDKMKAEHSEQLEQFEATIQQLQSTSPESAPVS